MLKSLLERVVMRLSKAFWLSAVAGIISLASVVHAQTPASSAKAAPAPAAAASAKPTEKAPAAARAASAPSSAATPAATGQIDGATYVVRLRDLEQHIDELKEQIRRSHT